MANLMINNYCNLKCHYCFADAAIKEPSFAMTPEQLTKILKYFEWDGCQLGLIGGEPLLHPQFAELYNQVCDHVTEWGGCCKVFTNGVKLAEYAPIFREGTVVLVNVNRDCEWSYRQLKRGLDAMEKLNKLDLVTLGVNISPDRDNYGFLWDLVDRYRKAAVRYAVVTPSGRLCQWLEDRDGYYAAAKPIFLQFCREAKEHNTVLKPDCAQIPMCYFREEELTVVREVVPGVASHTCGAVLDVKPDGETLWCFGSGKTDNLFKYSSIDTLASAIYKEQISAIVPKGKCKLCKEYNNRCSGGCLAFRG